MGGRGNWGRGGSEVGVHLTAWLRNSLIRNVIGFFVRVFFFVFFFSRGGGGGGGRCFSSTLYTLDLVFVRQNSNLFWKLTLCHRFSRTNLVVSVFFRLFLVYNAVNKQHAQWGTYSNDSVRNLVNHQTTVEVLYKPTMLLKLTVLSFRNFEHKIFKMPYK